MIEVGDRRPSKAEEAVSRVITEATREGGHRRKVLAGDFQASNADCVSRGNQ